MILLTMIVLLAGKTVDISGILPYLEYAFALIIIDTESISILKSKQITLLHSETFFIDTSRNFFTYTF